MSGGGLSKLGTALTVIFTISLLALFAEFFYVLWRRRMFRRRANSVVAGGDESSAYSPSSESIFSSSVASSKELLYFLCIRPQFRLPQNNSDTADGTTSNSDPNSNQQPDMEVIDIDLFKIQGMFGPPRFLFTIKEEEREDIESPAAAKSLFPPPAAADEKEVMKEKIDDDSIRSCKVSLEERFKEDEEAAAVVVEIDDRDGGVVDATPFSTPCASPAYFTPAGSPVHEVVEVGCRQKD